MIPDKRAVLLALGLVASAHLALPAIWGGGALAQQGGTEVTCANASARVIGATAREADSACAAAAKAVAHFAACGLAPRRPVVVTVVPPDAVICEENIYGRFDLKDQSIRVVSSKGCPRTEPAASPYATLSRAELFSSSVVHEVAHDLLWQSLAGRPVSQGAQEYVAHAVEIGALAPETRARFLAGQPTTEVHNLLAFGTNMLTMAPDKFAVLAWAHYSQPRNGCNMLRGIVTGEVHFPVPNE